MSPVALLFFAISMIAYVAGQIGIKRAMTASSDPNPANKQTRIVAFVAGIAGMAVSFFISLALLQKFDLSYVYPFYGMSVIIVSAAALIFLKEKITLQLGIGIALIALGVTLVSVS